MIFKDFSETNHSRKGLNALIWNRLPCGFEENEMAKEQKIMLDENVAFIYDELKKMGYLKVSKAPSGLTDKEIIKEISGKNIIFITKKFNHFARDYIDNYDLVGLPGEIKDEIRLAKAVDAVMRYIGPKGKGKTSHFVEKNQIYRGKKLLKKRFKK
jgi:hypothetical protein